MPYSLYWLIQYQDKSCYDFLQFFSYGILPFPNLSTEQRDRLRDTLDFPPEGSPNCPPVSSQGNNSKEDEVISDKN
ncbi:hypothetical protein [Dapis sp. BLCC M172]|uniref:hypothetical protein n=1 Tax=Dapis sp. BLCC M172 TaxID=2975281 RepID=UPI003CF0B8D0